MSKLSQLDLKDLRVFVAAVNAGSLSRAAQFLHISQPALTTRIARLEDDLQVRLLVRSSRGVTVTEEGRIFYASAKRLIQDLSDVREKLYDKGQHPTGAVSVGFAQSASRMVAVPFFGAACETLPKVRLSIAAGQSIDVYRRLTAGELDLGILSTRASIHGMDSRRLVREELFLGVSARHDPLPDKEEVEIDDLLRLDFAMPSSTIFSVADILKTAAGRSDVPLRVGAEIDSLEVLTSVVASGRLCALLGWSALHAAVLSGQITLKRVVGARFERSFDLCRPQERVSSAAVDAVETLLVSTIRGLIADGHWRHATID